MAQKEQVKCRRCNNVQGIVRVLYEESKITVFCIKDHPTEIKFTPEVRKPGRPRSDSEPHPLEEK